MSRKKWRLPRTCHKQRYRHSRFPANDGGRNLQVKLVKNRQIRRVKAQMKYNNDMAMDMIRFLSPDFQVVKGEQKYAIVLQFPLLRLGGMGRKKSRKKNSLTFQGS